MQRLRDEHHVLVEHRLEGVGVQLEVFDGGQPGRLEVVEEPDHVLEARVGHPDASAPHLLKLHLSSRNFQPISIRDSNQIFQNICPTTMCLFSSFNCMHCTNAYICENVINRAEPEPDFFLSMKFPLMTR